MKAADQQVLAVRGPERRVADGLKLRRQLPGLASGGRHHKDLSAGSGLPNPIGDPLAVGRKARTVAMVGDLSLVAAQGRDHVDTAAVSRGGKDNARAVR